MTPRKPERKFACSECGVLVVSRDKRSVICAAAKCRASLARKTYHNRLGTKLCKICGTTFKGKRQQTLCPECCTKSPCVWRNEIREIRCQCCGELRYNQIVKLPGTAPMRENKKAQKGRCRKCANKAISESKTGDKNPNWTGGPTKRKRPVYDQTPERRAEISARNSKRMRDHNPMRVAEVRERVHRSLKRRYDSGELSIPCGEKNQNWKGNRKRSLTIRTRVYKAWSKPLLKAAKRTCAICGDKKHRKEVHHSVERFAQIVKQFSTKPLEKLTYMEFEEVAQNVVKYHLQKPVAGQVLCVKCHKNIDYQRR